MKESFNKIRTAFKNLNFRYSFMAIITLFLIIIMGFQENTISDLKFNSDTMTRLYGYQEPDGGITYLEALGLQYLTLGSIFSYGVNENVITYYYEGLMNQDLVTETDALLDSTLDISNTTEEKYLSLEDVATIERANYQNSKGEAFEGNTTLTITIPKTLTSKNVKSASNAWRFTYHMYNDGLIGVDEAIWYSQLFEDINVFDRAWSSLKWLCQDKIQCDILIDYGDVFNVIVYGEGRNWFVNLRRLNGDAFNSGDSINYITMTVMAIDEEETLSLLGQYGLIPEVS